MRKKEVEQIKGVRSVGWVLSCRFREVRAGLAANEDVSQDFLDRGSEPGD